MDSNSRPTNSWIYQINNWVVNSPMQNLINITATIFLVLCFVPLAHFYDDRISNITNHELLSSKAVDYALVASIWVAIPPIIAVRISSF